MISKLPWLAPQQHFLCTMEDLRAQKHRLALRNSAGSAFTIDPKGATLPLPPKPEPVQVEAKVEEQAEALQPPQPAKSKVVEGSAKRSFTHRIPGFLWLRDRFRRDHVHMLIQIGPDIPVAKAVQYLKGGTSFKLRKEFPELEEFLWGDSFWADGYFAESVGVSEEEMIRKYIRDQKDDDQSMPRP